MTFDQIRSEVLERMSLSSTDASTRVGAAINRHYKRITSLLGMETTRYVSKDVLMTIGVRTVTVPGVEKVDRVADISGQPRPLSEVSLHQMRSLEPTAVEPQVWALSNTQAQSVVLMFDTFPAFAWTLRIDGWTTLTDLTGTGEPAFPASFHDILTWFVLAEELLRKEKSQLAAAYEQKAAGLLEDLRFHLADTHTRTLVQNSQPGGATGGSGQGGGGGAPGGAQYLTNIPPGTVVGRASDQGTGNSQPITTGPHLLMTGSVLDAVGYVDTAGTPGAGAIAEFADANTIRPTTRALVDKSGTPAAEQVAVFNDADTVAGAPNLTFGGVGLAIGPSPAQSGHVRLPKNCSIYSRNAGNTGDVSLLLTDAWDLLWLGGEAGVYLTAGHLQFPATQIPSGSPNTLDDYREGEWTPIIGGEAGESGQISSGSGVYTKIGRVVIAEFTVALSVKGTISGNVIVKGLPLAPDVGERATCAVMAYGLATTFASLLGLMSASPIGLTIRGIRTVGTDNYQPLTAADIGNSTQFRGSFVYHAAN